MCTVFEPASWCYSERRSIRSRLDPGCRLNRIRNANDLAPSNGGHLSETEAVVNTEITTTSEVPTPGPLQGRSPAKAPSGPRERQPWVKRFWKRACQREMGSNAELVGAILALAALWVAVIELRQLSADQTRATQYQAWQAITLARGHPGSGGRLQALEDLNRRGVSLAGVDVSTDREPGAYLAGVKLPSGDLRGAGFWYADLSLSDLRETNLEGAELAYVDLRGADLRGANLTDVLLAEANLTNADLRKATGLTFGRLSEASDWRGAKLPEGFERLELRAGASNDSFESLHDFARWNPTWLEKEGKGSRAKLVHMPAISAYACKNGGASSHVIGSISQTLRTHT